MNKLAGWITGFAVALALSALALRYYVPPLPGPLELTITFAAKNATEGEPLIVTGEKGHGDFVYVKFLDPATIVFGYDRWGSGGPQSGPLHIQPGRRYALRIESPSLAQVRGSPVRGPDKVRVTFEGKVVLEAAVPFDFRDPKHAWFAANPIGGSSCGLRFSGELARPDGRALRGSLRRALSFTDRIRAWLTTGCLQVVGVLLAAGAASWFAARVAGSSGAEAKAFAERHRMGPHRWFLTAAAPCVIVFCWFITDGTGRFTYPENFGDFYDYQAASLLQGRVDVPKDAISGEAFVVDGKYYGYFGLTPAVLRVPFVVFDFEFGCLSRGLMTACYAACLVAAYALLRHAVRRGRGAEARPGAFATGVFTLSVGLGSTLLFLGSRAYVYHEAILCGATFALWSAWFSLRWLEAPPSRYWLGALACGLFAVHARPTTGLFALTLLGCTAIAVAQAQREWRRPLAVAMVAAAAMLTFSGVSYLKFKTFDGSPFRYSIQYDAQRLARFEGRNFHLSNLRFNADAYLLQANFWLQPQFPWLVLDRLHRADYPEARLDHLEPTLAMPFAMPALFALATAGTLLALRPPGALRRDLAVLWAGVAPLAAAMLTIVVVSHRYSADFCPFLIAAGAGGIAAAETLPRRPLIVARAIVALLAVTATTLTVLITFWYQGAVVWGVPDHVKKTYQRVERSANELSRALHR